MIPLPVEVINIGFSNTISVENAIQFLSEYQNTFDFILLNHDEFSNCQPSQNNIYTTNEVYDLIDTVFVKMGGIHIFSIGLVEAQLSGTKHQNLFSSMHTNQNRRYMGQAISSSAHVSQLIHPIPIDVYYMIQLLSFSIRFSVGINMIHEREYDRYCLFHKKTDKRDMLETIKEGYISRISQKQINKVLTKQQRISFTTVLEHIKEIANSSNPDEALNTHLSQISLSNPARLRKLLNERFNIEGLKGLCIELDIDYENIVGETKESKINDLVAYMERREQLTKLAKKAIQPRP